METLKIPHSEKKPERLVRKDDIVEIQTLRGEKLEIFDF